MGNLALTPLAPNQIRQVALAAPAQRGSSPPEALAYLGTEATCSRRGPGVRGHILMDVTTTLGGPVVRLLAVVVVQGAAVAATGHAGGHAIALFRRRASRAPRSQACMSLPLLRWPQPVTAFTPPASEHTSWIS